MGQIYGWKKQQLDPRDLHFKVEEALDLPAMVDLRSGFGPVYDQGQYGSCTANAGSGAFEYDLDKQGLPDWMPSRFFLYYNTRVLDGDVTTDGGGTIRNTFKAMAQWGMAAESLWPYVDKDLLTKAPDAVYKAAAPDMISAYLAVNQDINSLKASISSGFPVDFGFEVFDSFESQAVADSGIVPMPNLSRENLLGGHSTLLVGYADAITVGGVDLTNVFISRNSWGSGWGAPKDASKPADRGYFFIPYAYVLDPNMASDFWVVNAVPGGVTPTPIPNPPNPCPKCPPCASPKVVQTKNSVVISW